MIFTGTKIEKAKKLKAKLDRYASRGKLKDHEKEVFDSIEGEVDSTKFLQVFDPNSNYILALYPLKFLKDQKESRVKQAIEYLKN